MAAEHGCQNVVTAVRDVSCNILQLRYAVFFFGGHNRYRGRTIKTLNSARERNTSLEKCKYNPYYVWMISLGVPFVSGDWRRKRACSRCAGASSTPGEGSACCTSSPRSWDWPVERTDGLFVTYTHLYWLQYKFRNGNDAYSGRKCLASSVGRSRDFLWRQHLRICDGCPALSPFSDFKLCSHYDGRSRDPAWSCITIVWLRN